MANALELLGIAAVVDLHLFPYGGGDLAGHFLVGAQQAARQFFVGVLQGLLNLGRGLLLAQAGEVKALTARVGVDFVQAERDLHLAHSIAVEAQGIALGGHVLTDLPVGFLQDADGLLGAVNGRAVVALQHIELVVQLLQLQVAPRFAALAILRVGVVLFQGLNLGLGFLDLLFSDHIAVVGAVEQAAALAHELVAVHVAAKVASQPLANHFFVLEHTAQVGCDQRNSDGQARAGHTTCRCTCRAARSGRGACAQNHVQGGLGCAPVQPIACARRPTAHSQAIGNVGAHPLQEVVTGIPAIEGASHAVGGIGIAGHPENVAAARVIAAAEYPAHGTQARDAQE